MGDAMEEGTILRWLKKPGDKLVLGETVAEIETEKATIEIPALVEGDLTEILVKEGQTVQVGATIAIVGGQDGGAAPAPKPAEEKKKTPEPQPVDNSGGAVVQPEPTPVAPTAPAGGRVKASPLARKVAAEHGIDLSGVRGTGPGGRIIEADVEDALRSRPAGPAAAPAFTPPAAVPSTLTGERRPMSTMRKVIARRLQQSKQTIPHFYLTIEVDMRSAFRLRKEFNASVDEDRRISFNDMVVRACALALLKFPQLGSQLDGEAIVLPDTVSVGVAVALDEGLIVPVVRDAHVKSLSTLGSEIRQLAERARKGQLQPSEYSGGTFTVSNLGMFDIAQFQAIINPPEAAIMAVGTIREVPIVDNGQVVPGKQMSLTISVDHRLVDGHTGAQFMQEVKRLLQSPISLFG